jgi:hypothetical protein
MSFNKKYVNYEKTLLALKSDTLVDFYNKTDTFIFEDSKSLKVYELFVEGKTSKQILNIINE